jgi:hypothetical protein
LPSPEAASGACEALAQSSTEENDALLYALTAHKGL